VTGEDVPPGLRATWDQLHAELDRVRRHHIRLERQRRWMLAATYFQLGAVVTYLAAIITRGIAG